MINNFVPAGIQAYIALRRAVCLIFALPCRSVLGHMLGTWMDEFYFHFNL